MVYLLVAISVLAMAASQLLLKKGLLLIGHSPQGFGELLRFFIRAYTNIYIISAVLLVIVTALAWMLAVSKTELSRIYPFMALSYVLVALFSMLLLNENVSVLRWVGIVVVCAGVFLVLRS